MKKINGFTITKLSMSGFKCFENTAIFDFGDTTFITASNGQGKSSIADAIAFAFVGTPFFGDRGLDRLHNRNMDEMTVSVDFVDDAGETHNITRTRKHENTSIEYDGLNVRQSDLNSAFGDKDVFLSILNPLYFINVLGDSGKSLLEKLLPVVSNEEVMASLSEHSREILEGQSLLSPETFIKNRRGELSDDGKYRLHKSDKLKNKSSYRSMPINDDLHNFLCDLRRKQDENKKFAGNVYNNEYNEYVCVNDLGRILLPNYVTKKFKELFY